MQPHGIHHIHRRKRLDQGLEPYPHSRKFIRFLDKFLIAIAVISPFTSLPQLYTIITQKSAIGVSLLSWTLYAIFAIPWLIYGLVHNEKPIIIAYALWIVFDAAIVFATLAYC